MTKSPAISLKYTTEQVKELVVQSIQDKKGADIVCLDLRKINEAITDYFIICEADSTVQVKAIADEIYRHIKEQTGYYATHTEGYDYLEWVLLDYIDIVVHIFYKDKRKFYNLEELWGDAQVEQFQEV